MRKFFLLFLVLNAIVAKAASVDTLYISTEYLGTPEEVVVISPNPKDSLSKFPTVYLLNGYSGNHLSWIELTPELFEMSDSYGMIFVMPDGQDSWYWDSPVDSTMQMESFIVKELVPYIDDSYSTIPTSDFRAISGLSMGGHGAMWLALRHPEIWGNVASMSGGLDIRPFPENWKMKERLGSFEENPERWNDFTVINLVPNLKAGSLNIAFDCGKDDFFFGVNNAMHEALLESGIDHDYTVRSGAHTAAYWRNSLPYHILFFAKAFENASHLKD